MFLLAWLLAMPALAAVSVKDDSGATLTLPRPAQRIVSLAPHLTELLFAAGAGASVVGVGAFADYPEAAKKLPQVGDSAMLDLERIVALKPDLLVVWRDGNSPQQLAKLATLGIPVYASELGTLADIASTLRRLGRLAGSEAAAEARAAAFEQRVRAYRAQLDALRIDVHDIAIDRGAHAGAWFAVREACYAALLAPVGLWGRLTHWVPIQLTRRLALRNVQSRDEPAMNTLVIGLVLVLAAYAIQTTLVGLTLGWWWALAFLLTLVPSASSDLWYGDRTRRARQRAGAYRQFRADPALQQALLAEADAIRADAAALERAVSTAR